MALAHVLMQESCVIFSPYSFEYHSQKVVVGFENALFHSIALNMLHSRNRFQNGQHRVIHLNGVEVTCLQSHEATHLNVASKSDNLVADSMFEAQHNTYGYQHHGKTDSHACRSYSYGRARYLFSLGLATIDFPCYEKR